VVVLAGDSGLTNTITSPSLCLCSSSRARSLLSPQATEKAQWHTTRITWVIVNYALSRRRSSSLPSISVQASSTVDFVVSSDVICHLTPCPWIVSISFLIEVQDIGTRTPTCKYKFWAVPGGMCTNLLHSDFVPSWNLCRVDIALYN
jgi:hypothetical protein